MLVAALTVQGAPTDFEPPNHTSPSPPAQDAPHQTRGRHLVVDLHGCDPHRISVIGPLRLAMLAAAREAGARVIGDRFHAFEAGGGVSGVILLAESHLSIHTWPETGYVALDIYTCGRHVQPERACTALAEALGAGRLTMTEIRRGDLTASNIHSHTVLGTEHRGVHAMTGADSW